MQLAQYYTGKKTLSARVASATPPSRHRRATVMPPSCHRSPLYHLALQ
ncbi:hypothetical protein BIFGAL_03779 [Bifidobacterium gallicum DSM 20093 = LMG 11596]|uniref:Uncharacterized protein n=1 Tax=Bifidobacterium gallicum DSM 20093 = LMG 11596 TaxID=561180 RepID=D1NV95_9BIFI|nr:hypothetical protein BIFGAL_03779 [Bifidobacterium gallicum DSM 20093 = LMG 11596]